MEAIVVVYIDRILNVIAIETDGILADGTREGVLQEPDLVVVDVDIGKYLVHKGRQDVACLNEVVHTRGVHALDNRLLVVRVLSVDFLRDSLVYRDGENEFVVVGTTLNLVNEPLFLLELRRVQQLWGYFVECQRQFLVLVVLVEVMVVKVGLLLVLHDLLHQFYGRVVLAAVSRAFRLHGHFLQCPCVRLQLHVEG